jgi:hypothetical protein
MTQVFNRIQCIYRYLLEIHKVSDCLILNQLPNKNTEHIKNALMTQMIMIMTQTDNKKDNKSIQNNEVFTSTCNEKTDLFLNNFWT